MAGRPRPASRPVRLRRPPGRPQGSTYEVDANWKFIAENYSECYHCPGIHPQLNKLTPYDLGGDFAPDGPWQGGWMELVDSAETMAMDGGHRAAGRRWPASPSSTSGGSTTTCSGRRHSCRSIPTTCSSTGWSRPGRATPGSSASGCSSRTTIAAPGFDPSDAVAFWDLTNRQDWHVCELQQQGTRSRSWVAGRYSNQEPSVHAFDLMAVDRYAGDGGCSRRTVRLRYDVPAPKPGEEQDRMAEGNVPAVPLPPLRGADRGPGQGAMTAGPVAARPRRSGRHRLRPSVTAGDRRRGTCRAARR